MGIYYIALYHFDRKFKYAEGATNVLIAQSTSLDILSVPIRYKRTLGLGPCWKTKEAKVQWQQRTASSVAKESIYVFQKGEKVDFKN